MSVGKARMLTTQKKMMIRLTMKMLVGSVVRWLLNSTLVWLLAYNFLTNGHWAAFVAWMLGALCVLLWSQIQKLRTICWIDEALQLPAKSTFEDLGEVIQ